MRKEALLVLGLMALGLVACGSSDAVGDGETVTVNMTDFEFAPSELHFAVGTTVTIELVNDGAVDHEFMAGREVHMEDGVPHGFESDFFETVDGLTVTPPDAQEMEMDEMGDTGSETTMGDMSSDSTMGDMDSEDMHMDDMQVMVVREPTQTATITFTVTEASLGEWTIGCFEDHGAHWEAGMEGKIIVEEA